MKVYTELVSLNLALGAMERDGDVVLIKSNPEKSIPAEVEMSAHDMVDVIRAALNWPVISFVLQLPLLYYKEKKAEKSGQQV